MTTLSDIVSADGQVVLTLSWNGLQIPDRSSTMQFARQLQPTVYQRGLWRRLLRSYLIPGSKASALQLQQPLGVWITEPNMRWGAMTWEETLYRRDPYTDRSERSVALHFPRNLVHSDGTPTSGHFYDTKPDWYTAGIPRLAVPTDISGNQIFLTTHSSLRYDSIPAPADTFAAWVSQLPPAERRLLSSIYFAECNSEEVLVQYLQLDCTLFIGTDGGKRHHSGSFSWIICSPGQEQLVLNSGPVDGWHRCQTSLRSEAAALASVTLYLDELSAFFDLRIHCSFQLYVDSNSAITNVQNLRDLIPKRRYAHNADILSTMAAAHPVLVRFTLVHVKSHQDDTTEFDDLPFSAKLNVLCDTMATNQLQRQKRSAPERSRACPFTPRNLPVEISYRRQVISSHYVSILRDEIGLARHRSFLQHKYNWTDQSWDAIAWDSFHLSARRTLHKQAAFRSKLVHSWLPFGLRRAKLNPTTPSTSLHQCPMCHAPEDLLHMLTCPSPRAKKIRYDASTRLRKALDDSPGTSALLRAAQQWSSAPDNPVIIPYGDTSSATHIDDALQCQTTIGWVNVFRGFISLRWGGISARSDNTTSDGSCTDAIPRLASAVRAFQDYTLALWTGRNLILHDQSQLSLSIVHASLDHAITSMYAIRTSLSDHLSSYFGLSLADRLRQSPRQRRRWLRLVRLATSHSSSSGITQQLISVYFPYVESMAPSTTEFHDLLGSHADLDPYTLPVPARLQPKISSYFPGVRPHVPSGAQVSPDTIDTLPQPSPTSPALYDSPRASPTMTSHHV